MEKVATKPVSLAYLLDMFDDSVHEQIRALAASPETTDLVVFDCLQMDSSSLGKRTVVCVGPTRTYRTLDEAQAGRLGDLPSNFQYPQAHWSKGD